MKKFLPVLILLSLPFFASAQNCTPDQNLNQSGYYPSQLPSGSSGAAYSETVQFVIPQDTQVNYNGSTVNATIDSIKVVDLQGLPSNLGYVCNPGSCALPGGQTSCGNIYGTIDSSESGNYPVLIPIIVYARVGGSFPVQQKDTIKKFSLTVVGPNAIPGIVYQKLLVYPNPANREAHLLLPESATEAKVSLFNNAGQEVSVDVYIQDQEISLQTTHLPSGVYYGTVNTEQHVYRFKLIRR